MHRTRWRPMIKLSAVAHGRDNNFHLLRLLAAAAVLLSHSYPLVTGDKASEPLRAWLGATPGSIAVDFFFLISGMLVTASLLRRGSAIDFVKARFFRIWPGLAVALLLTIFVLGPAFTSLGLHDYFASTSTWRYAAKNLLLVTGIVYTLPGVFAATPWKDAVNGSLWTLPHEIYCYLYLLAGWLVLSRIRGGDWFRRGVAALWMALFALHLHAMFVRHLSLEDSPVRLYLMFCTGAGLYVFRERIHLSWATFGAVAGVLALSTLDRAAFGLVYSLAVPYVMLGLAYLPSGRVLLFNRLGDYSYGTYIYAYPLQQALMATFPGLSPLALLASALPLTLVFAVVSWHVIEEPASKLARPARSRVLASSVPGRP
jgi:peptidoglycan/LPS O-acetylase OafA/YrhL